MRSVNLQSLHVVLHRPIIVSKIRKCFADVVKSVNVVGIELQQCRIRVKRAPKVPSLLLDCSLVEPTLLKVGISACRYQLESVQSRLALPGVVLVHRLLHSGNGSECDCRRGRRLTQACPDDDNEV
eukprot:CAMPEP_0118632264 /NCGR_PEP_ID=MMETSP0785-20121206/351_1 /TAXON_ID=91992 /ORGANISM="Bolidomonas pacifica, Strain CCMP 1866" /LENGTH=125 /DNA_ID=CAMNT_0006523021 /DNA_START=312 /DNA_END=689 /DNA_ORIENTATION=+